MRLRQEAKILKIQSPSSRRCPKRNDVCFHPATREQVPHNDVCRVRGASRSGYYAALDRPEGKRK